MSNLYPESIVAAPDPLPELFDHLCWRVKRRIGAVGMLWNRPSDAWLNIRELRAAERKAVFASLEQNVELKGIDLMKQYLSSVKYERIESMVVLSGTAIGNEPEDAIIGTMNRLANAYGLDVLRSFGFDSPVEGTEDVTMLRGYEFWLSIDESMHSKLPDPERFMFEDTEVTVKRVPGYRYATLRITDPMVDGIMVMDIYIPVDVA